MPISPAIQEAEIRKIVVQIQPIVLRDLIWKNPSQKRAGGVAQGVGPEFKLQNLKKKIYIFLEFQTIESLFIRVWLYLFFPCSPYN
jgi:hypothetical protein